MQAAVLKFTIFVLQELFPNKFGVTVLSEELNRALFCTNECWSWHRKEGGCYITKIFNETEDFCFWL